MTPIEITSVMIAFGLGAFAATVFGKKTDKSDFEARVQNNQGNVYDLSKKIDLVIEYLDIEVKETKPHFEKRKK